MPNVNTAALRKVIGMRAAPTDTMLPPPGGGPPATTAPYNGRLGASEYGGLGNGYAFNVPIVASRFFGPGGFFPNTGTPVSGATMYPTNWSDLNTGDPSVYAPTAIPTTGTPSPPDTSNQYTGPQVGPAANPADSAGITMPTWMLARYL